MEENKLRKDKKKLWKTIENISINLYCINFFIIIQFFIIIKKL